MTERPGAAANDERSPLVRGLMRPEAYPHPTRDIRVVETHISSILLTGEHAYKLKKPVDVGFANFTTLARRRKFCDEELRLNRRFVPELYVDVVEIRGTPDTPTIGGDGELLDVAVHMRQFDPARQLDAELDAGTLDVRDMDELARSIAEIHAGAPRAEPETSWGEPGVVVDAALANFPPIRDACRNADQRDRVDALEAHAERASARLTPRFAARKAGGFVRECHGDLHLSNLVRLPIGIRAFDCIEFAPELRWIDVASDLAFPIMDLQVRGRDDLAYRLANEYLEITGDYACTGLLDYYLSYRTLVRAKVAALRLSDPDLGDARPETEARFERHVALAQRYAAPRPRAIVMMRGLSGSGKSWLAARLVAPLEAFRVRSDVERKRLAGLDRFADSRSAAGRGIYTARGTDETYRRLAELASAIVASGHPAIVDATHLTRARRAPITAAARDAGVPCIVVDCQAPRDVLEARVGARAAPGRDAPDASEAGLGVLRRQQDEDEPIAPDECDARIGVDTSGPIDPDRCAAEIAAACGR